MNLSASQTQEPAEGPARSALIWLHGLGATAENFSDLGLLLQCPGLRVIALQAPTLPISVFAGQSAPAWFDIYQGDDGKVVSDLAGLEETAKRIRAELHTQREAGIARLAVGGFSQGGAQALFTALTHPEALDAVVCLSGYLPQDEHLAQQADKLTLDAPMFMAHGQDDEVVPLAHGKATCDWLQQRKVPVQFLSGAFGHTVTEDVLEGLGAFLRARLNDGGSDAAS